LKTISKALKELLQPTESKKPFLFASAEGQQDESDTSVKLLKSSDASPLLKQLFCIYHKYAVKDSLEREYEALNTEIDNQS
jgi:hypothetical protein